MNPSFPMKTKTTMRKRGNVETRKRWTRRRSSGRFERRKRRWSEKNWRDAAR